MANCTQLARVADRSPLLQPLAVASHTSASRSCVVVKIRPTLLHFLVDSHVRAVIRSPVPITDIADFGNSQSERGEAHNLLVSVADGNMWIVTLPDPFQPGEMKELLLERTSRASDGAVQWFYQLPGVQSVDHIAIDTGLTSLTLMRSFVTPTTLIVSTRESSQSKLQSHQSLELADIEGEQSTCTLCLSSQVVSHTALLKSLFPDVVNFSSVASILVGDLDGFVRFSLVQYSGKASAIRSGTLLRLGEPVQMIVPFVSSVPVAPFSETHDSKLPLEIFDALLVVGARGRIGVVELKNRCVLDSLPIPVNKLELGSAVQSLGFVSSLGVFVFCSHGSAFVFKSTDLLEKVHATNSEANSAVTKNSSISVEKLPFQSGIMRLSTQGNAVDMSILFASGRVITIDDAIFRTVATSVLPLPGQQDRSYGGSPSTSKRVRESRVRNLLHEIAQISLDSSSLRTKSKHMDHQLKTLHSALDILRVVEATGIESVVKCELRASMITTGCFSDRQTVKLVCSLRFINPQAIISLDDWSLCMYVRIRQHAVTTYSFPTKAIAMHEEQSFILDPDALAQQDQASVWVSCSMVFCPSSLGYAENKHGEAIGPKTNQDTPLLFGIPLLQDRRFLLAQLSQPLEKETPVSQVAIHAAFRQNHEPFMPVDRTSKGGKPSSSALWGGVQWWDALADHAQKNPSFAILWSKIAPSASPSLDLSPPSRFVISIPSFFAAEDDDDDDDIDEDIEKVRVEKMVSFLRQLLEIPIDELPRLRRSCRVQHGKLWTALRTFSGSLILLRFTPSEDRQRSVELTIQCSDVADLSAMRALVLETINNWSDGGSRAISKHESSEDVALNMDEMLEPIVVLESLLEGLAMKVANSIEDPNSATCTDEILRALSQLAHLETQTLTMYWKIR